MKAQKVYEHLDKDFIKPQHSDDWTSHMTDIDNYLSQNFKEKQMWLICDFTDEINKVFTAVFPSEKIMQQIINSWTQNAMLFLHHPMIWDIRKTPVFENMNKNLLEEFKKNNISVYALHVPLDDFWEYSTSVNLAKALNIKIKEKFLPYFWAFAWVVWEIENQSLDEMKDIFSKAVWHEVKLYDYSNGKINNNKVAIIAWWWLTEWIQEVKDKWVSLFITGISAKNDHSEKTHKFAEENAISILWGTHYSTEKFACIDMKKYFEKLWIQSEFISDDPVLEDM